MSHTRPGTRVGRWNLQEKLGEGGNGEVWRARNPTDGQEIALKLLKNRKPNSEPFARFRQEIELNKRISGRPGVLPLLDSHLPDEGSSESRAWLATPIAEPIRTALTDQPSIQAVVEAVASIASTLADLARDGIAHRDVKPDNLFRYQGNWVIGDFGIASFPGKAALTRPGKSLGPRFFIPDEFIQHPDKADPHSADVFSLAKTLWVLATRNNYPPQGHQRRETAATLLGSYFPECRAYLLDHLIERATSSNVAERPSMETVAGELRAWLAPPAYPQKPENLSEIAKRFHVLLQPAAERARRNQAREKEATALFQKLALDLTDIWNHVHRLPHVQIATDELPMSFGHEEELPGEEFGSHCVVTRAPSDTETVLYSGFRLHIHGDDAFVLAQHLVLTGGFSYNTAWQKRCSFPLGSALQEQCRTDFVTQLNQNLGSALLQVIQEVEWYQEHPL